MAAPEEVVLDGRKYRLVVHEPNCASLRHYHDEEHEDGTPGQPSHHHHSERCASMPRQATLYPPGHPAIR